MLRSEKHRSRKHRAFAIPTQGFDGEAAEREQGNAGDRNKDVVTTFMREFRLPE